LLRTRSDVTIERLQTGNLHDQIRAASAFISTLTVPRDLLRDRLFTRRPASRRCIW
jgi:hypothetical protein